MIFRLEVTAPKPAHRRHRSRAENIISILLLDPKEIWP